MSTEHAHDMSPPNKAGKLALRWRTNWPMSAMFSSTRFDEAALAAELVAEASFRRLHLVTRLAGTSARIRASDHKNSDLKSPFLTQTVPAEAVRHTVLPLHPQHQAVDEQGDFARAQPLFFGDAPGPRLGQAVVARKVLVHLPLRTLQMRFWLCLRLHLLVSELPDYIASQCVTRALELTGTCDIQRAQLPLSA